MRKRHNHRLGPALALLGIAIVSASGAGAAPINGATAVSTNFKHLPVNRRLTVLHDQSNSIDSIPQYGATSNFHSNGFSLFDSAAADDFVVPAHHSWTIKEIDVAGFESDYSSTIQAVDVHIYTISGGSTNEVYTSLGVPVINSYGNFVISLPLGAVLDATASAKGKRFWMSVVANIATANAWYWSTRTVTTYQYGAWENPSGVLSRCRSWTVETACNDYIQVRGDHAFTLRGSFG